MGPGFEPEGMTRVEGYLKEVTTVRGYAFVALVGALLGGFLCDAPATGAGIGLFILAARDLLEGE